MTLSKSQIEHIRSFINARGFVHIEVEMEILDHVASSVENLMEAEPELTLDEAIQKVHRSFGVMGFSSFEDEVKANLGKKIFRLYRKQLWQHWTSLMAVKVALSALFIFAALTLLFNSLEPGLFKIAAFAILGLAGCIPAFYHQSIFRKWAKRSLMLGSLLWPFLFSTLGAAYLIQIIPVDVLKEDRALFNAIVIGLSLIVSSCTWASLALVKEVYNYTDQHWLKYVKQ